MYKRTLEVYVNRCFHEQAAQPSLYKIFNYCKLCFSCTSSCVR